MHKASKLFAIIVATVLFFNSVGVAKASTSKPSSIWDWTKGAYSFSGSASYEDLYTNYRFTNMTTANITVKNTASSGSVTVKLKSVEPWYKPDKTVSTATSPAGGTCTWSKDGLDSDKQYYIVFIAPCYFSGSISR